MLSSLYFPVTCDPSRVVTLPNIGVPHYIGVLHRVTRPRTLHPTPYTLHPTPYTLRTLHPTPFTLHPTPYTPHPTPYTLHPTPCTQHSTPHLLQVRHVGGLDAMEAAKSLARLDGNLIGNEFQFKTFWQ